MSATRERVAGAVETFASASRLAFWLGPWHDGPAPRAPSRIVRRSEIAGETVAYVFASPDARLRTRGTYLVLPGLHYEGPDDARLDRFCRVLAASGFLVVAPIIRSYRSLVLEPTAFDDARAALELAHDLARSEGHAAPAVFSISFGSRLAIDLGAQANPPSELLLFGGYAEFFPTVRFAVSGVATTLDGSALDLPHDLLNAPAVFLNLLPELDVSDRAALSAAWISMVRATWGKNELKRGDARRPFAEAIARDLSPALREPFLRGCGLSSDHVAWLEDGIGRATDRLAFMDARADLANVRCAVTVVHGRDDDVIPCTESDKLAAWLPSKHLRGAHRTGMYGHTGASGVPLRQAAREARVMAKILWSLASAPRRTPSRGGEFTSGETPK